MRLHDVANTFNNMECQDAYSGILVFKGQLGLYDDNKRDSETAERRVLSLSPAAVVPPRRVIAAAGTRFIVGHANPDDYRGATIRIGYVVQEATDLSQVRTLAQVCLDQPGFSAYAGRAWVKDLSYTQQSSKETPEHHIHFAAGEPVVPNLLVSFAGRLNVVRSTNFGAGGTLVATCEEMPPGAVETAQVASGAYDPAIASNIGSAIPVRVVRMRWQSLFSYGTSIAPKFQPGDIQVAVAKADFDVKAGALLGMSDGTWMVHSVVSEGMVWLCRATRHG
jgi:hypothetical protein